LRKIKKKVNLCVTLANDVFKKGEYDQAIKLYTDLIELDPENKSFNSTIYANRSLCLQKKKKFIEALSDINKSIKLNEDYTKVRKYKVTLGLS
jgi:tetratricopeptide (TPR) repeat protein